MFTINCQPVVSKIVDVTVTDVVRRDGVVVHPCELLQICTTVNETIEYINTYFNIYTANGRRTYDIFVGEYHDSYYNIETEYDATGYHITMRGDIYDIVKIKNGVLYGVQTDSCKRIVTYDNGVMRGPCSDICNMFIRIGDYDYSETSIRRMNFGYYYNVKNLNYYLIYCFYSNKNITFE